MVDCYTMKKYTLILLIAFSLFAKDIRPTTVYKSVGFVNDFVVNGNRLFVAGDAGVVDVFDIKSAKIVNQISLPPLTSSIKQIIPADILSVDYLNGKLLILSVGDNSYRNVWIYENNRLKQIIDEGKKLVIKRAKFVNDEKIMFATIGSDIMLYDTKEAYSLYNTHVSSSTMGDIALSFDKKEMAMSDESGEVNIIDVATSKVLKSHNSQNVDNVYKVAYSNGTIITAGQDRRVGVYQKNQKPYYINSDFLVFCVGLTPSGNLGIYSSGEENALQLFDIKTKVKYDRLVGHKNIVNNIAFINEKELFSSSRGNSVYYWKLK